jgi:hypothetical protein
MMNQARQRQSNGGNNIDKNASCLELEMVHTSRRFLLKPIHPHKTRFCAHVVKRLLTLVIVFVLVKLVAYEKLTITIFL